MSQHLPSPVSFREDINGLRSWAVLAVLLFHFSLIGLPSGFIGVDIFYVISGYLMTAIVFRGIEKGSFSLVKFYMSRVRRILPALLAVIAVLLAIGWFVLPDPDYKTLGAQSVFSLAFLSNYFYWVHAGYFDGVAQDKWLLHTWSLAVEAQFYITYPLILLVVWKLFHSLKAAFISILVLFLASFVFSLVLGQSDPNGAFYLFPSRAWELLFGGLIFLAPRILTVDDKVRSLSFYAGWGMLFSGLIFIHHGTLWPNFSTLLPVLGTGLIILANRSDSVLVSNQPFQWLGDRSYSLYLWHWPVVVLLFFAEVHGSWLWTLSGFALSIMLAHLSYQLIEVPTRKYFSRQILLKEVIIIGFVMGVVGATALGVRLLPLGDRFDEKVVAAANQTYGFNPDMYNCLEVSHSTGKTVDCYASEDKSLPLGILAIGDSHNQAVFSALGQVALEKNKNALHWSMNGCMHIEDSNSTEVKSNPLCESFTQEATEKRKAYPDIPIVLIERFGGAILAKNAFPFEDPALHFVIAEEDIDFNNSGYLEAFEKTYTDTVCDIAKTNPVYLMRPIPEIAIDVPKVISRRMIFDENYQDVKIPRADYEQRNKEVFAILERVAVQCGATVLDPAPYLCDQQFCYGSKDGMPWYFDGDHLNEVGNKRLVPMFEQIFTTQSSN